MLLTSLNTNTVGIIGIICFCVSLATIFIDCERNKKIKALQVETVILAIIGIALMSMWCFDKYI